MFAVKNEYSDNNWDRMHFCIYYKDCGCLETYLLTFTDRFLCYDVHPREIDYQKKQTIVGVQFVSCYLDGGRSEREVCCLLKVLYFYKNYNPIFFF